MDDQRPYWDGVAEQKTFSHPLHEAWLDAWLPRSARILDYGCGYGRTLAELADRGFENGVGMDFSARMIERGRRSYPRLDLRVIDGLPVAEPDSSFDAVLLFAVLTCVPADDDQSQLIAELRRLLRPGGVLYISDMPLQLDARNLARYAAGRFGTWGVFRTDDGVMVRHHAPQHFRGLLRDFELTDMRPLPLKTMNGNLAMGVQILARRPER
jgi:SAM-dependent methyltransferase